MEAHRTSDQCRGILLTVSWNSLLISAVDLGEAAPKAEATPMKVEITGRIGGRHLEPYPLEVVERDEKHDLCVLRLPYNPSHWPTIQTIGEPY